MNADILLRHFERIGARVKVDVSRLAPGSTGVRIDIGRDSDGEFFEIGVARDTAPNLTVLDARPQLRHLLLMSRTGDEKHKFLCGHDERHWFVAAIPEQAPASNVKTAFEALKPIAVRRLQDRLKVKPRKRNSRRNEAFIRQGEWFFVPMVGFKPDAKLILHNELIRRGGGKPHYCEELVRQGGELVYVSLQHPLGLTEREYRRLLSQRQELRSLHWITQRRNPLVFVRGKVRHADHKTIILLGWHEVLMNTETQAAAMRHVAFID
jgi:hypothetical protein